MLAGGASWPLVQGLKIVDVGAAWFGEDLEAYARLMKALPCQVVGFEPFARECDKLRAMGRPGHTYLPYVIGDGTPQTFYECRAMYTSSLLPPNTALIEKFQGLGELMTVAQEHPVETRRLDDIPETAGADYLKVDVQGGEMMVLEGATARLKELLVIHTEVEFAPLYKNQPLFADIDAFLRGRGFMLHKFTNLTGRALRPIVVNEDVHSALNQVLWGDAVYVRDLQSFDEMAPQALCKLAAIVHENYGSFDLAAAALAVCDQRQNSAYMADFMDRLMAEAQTA